jgi:hypothetical protein
MQQFHGSAAGVVVVANVCEAGSDEEVCGEASYECEKQETGKDGLSMTESCSPSEKVSAVLAVLLA